MELGHHAEPRTGLQARAEAEDLAVALADLLAEEAEALRSAAFDRLEPLAAAKLQLSQALAAASPLPAETVRGLQARAMRNAALLEGTRAGLRAAGDRLAALTAPPPALQTYDGSGRRAVLSAPGPTATRRA